MALILGCFFVPLFPSAFFQLGITVSLGSHTTREYARPQWPRTQLFLVRTSRCDTVSRQYRRGQRLGLASQTDFAQSRPCKPVGNAAARSLSGESADNVDDQRRMRSGPTSHSPSAVTAVGNRMRPSHCDCQAGNSDKESRPLRPGSPELASRHRHLASRSVRAPQRPRPSCRLARAVDAVRMNVRGRNATALADTNKQSNKARRTVLPPDQGSRCERRGYSFGARFHFEKKEGSEGQGHSGWKQPRRGLDFPAWCDGRLWSAWREEETAERSPMCVLEIGLRKASGSDNPTETVGITITSNSSGPFAPSRHSIC